MKFKEVKILNNNPEWLIEILVEFKEKKEEDVNSIISKPETKQQEIIEDVIKEKDEESISDKGDNEKKSIELIDVLNAAYTFEQKIKFRENYKPEFKK